MALSSGLLIALIGFDSASHTLERKPTRPPFENAHPSDPSPGYWVGCRPIRFAASVGPPRIPALIHCSNGSALAVSRALTMNSPVATLMLEITFPAPLVNQASRLSRLDGAPGIWPPSSKPPILSIVGVWKTFASLLK